MQDVFEESDQMSNFPKASVHAHIFTCSYISSLLGRRVPSSLILASMKSRLAFSTEMCQMLKDFWFWLLAVHVAPKLAKNVKSAAHWVRSITIYNLHKKTFHSDQYQALVPLAHPPAFGENCLAANPPFLQLYHSIAQKTSKWL